MKVKTRSLPLPFGLMAAGALALMSPMTASAYAFDLPLVWGFADSFNQGFVRIRNYDSSGRTLRFRAFENDGTQSISASVRFGPWEVKHFNSADLFNGNSSKGLSTGLGLDGDLRLRIESPGNGWVEAMSYVRTPTGFLTSVLPSVKAYKDDQYSPPWLAVVHTFNPASNSN